MTRECVINSYMMNEKHVIAEMLYDTIAKYEAQLTSKEKRLNKSLRWGRTQRDYAHKYYKENKALKKQLSSNPLQLTKHIGDFTNEELMVELSSRGIDGDEFDEFADEYNNEWGEE